MLHIRDEAKGTSHSPQEISSVLIKHLKKIAEDHLKKPIKHAIITVPASFNNAQRKATRDAGVLAGLSVERLVSEPTAVALAYGIDIHTDPKVVIYSLVSNREPLPQLTVPREVDPLMFLLLQVMNWYLKLLQLMVIP